MIFSYRYILLALLSLVLTGCQPTVSGPTNPPPEQQPQLLDTSKPTATNTPVWIAKTPAMSAPDQGEVEVRIINTINGQGECNNLIPFRIYEQGERIMLEGDGRIDCTFEGKPLGGEDSPIVYHVSLEFEAILEGERLPATPSRPSGWLDAFLLLDGTIVQYYTGYPPEAVNPCPLESPCETTTKDNIPLPFEFKEGSTIETPHTFILHLW
jgi:hypothetical protein